MPVILYKFKSLPTEEQDYTLNIQYDSQYIISDNATVDLKIVKNQTPDLNGINTASNMGEFSGNLGLVMVPTAEYGCLVATAFNYDQAGAILRFSQITKLFARFRFVEVNYGALLNQYFRKSAEKYDKASTKGMDYIVINSTGTHGKYTSE